MPRYRMILRGIARHRDRSAPFRKVARPYTHGGTPRDDGVRPIAQLRRTFAGRPCIEETRSVVRKLSLVLSTERPCPISIELRAVRNLRRYVSSLDSSRSIAPRPENPLFSRENNSYLSGSSAFPFIFIIVGTTEPYFYVLLILVYRDSLIICYYYPR